MITISLLSLSAFLFYLDSVTGHGMIMDPVNRASAFRKGFKTKPDWDDDGHMCGMHRYKDPGTAASCLPCGVRRFPSSGPVVKTYSPGQVIDIQMRITANHQGYASFKICPGEGNPTQECFDKHPLKILNSPNQGKPEDWYDWSDRRNDMKIIKAQLPAGLTCNPCVMQWHWQTNNNWHTEKAEVWRQCSDIAIVPGAAREVEREVIIEVPTKSPAFLRKWGVLTDEDYEEEILS